MLKKPFRAPMIFYIVLSLPSEKAALSRKCISDLACVPDVRACMRVKRKKRVLRLKQSHLPYLYAFLSREEIVPNLQLLQNGDTFLEQIGELVYVYVNFRYEMYRDISMCVFRDRFKKNSFYKSLKYKYLLSIHILKFF